MLSVKEVATRLKLYPQSVRRLIKRGLLSATRVGTFWVVSEEALACYKTTRRTVGRPRKHPVQESA